MSYLVLARKWRPQTFSAMVGQQHVLQALINALDNQRLHHAYLFTGTRGVGKTTIARILAKCLNCEAGISSTPCGECASCIAIDAGRFVDLIEVDAASRTKVEDTREILDNVQYAPTQGRYKVYLIDEVHMLSGHSFNALLKTLEEPPEHVKFLLATTDPQKLPVTVLSRCLQFHLKNMLPEQIVAHLTHILQQENISAEEPALWQIAQAADGSMRDALSLLDQAIAFSNAGITESAMRDMLGTVEQSHIHALITALQQRDGNAIFQTCREFAELGIDFNNALSNLLTALHFIALAQTVPTAIDDNVPHANFLREQATLFSAQDIQLFYQIGLLGQRDIPLAPSPRVGFEMVLLRMLAFQPGKSAPLPTPEATPTAEKKTAPVAQPDGPPVATKEPAPATEPNVETSTVNSVTPADSWEAMVPQLKLSGMSHALADNCVLVRREGNQIELHLAPTHAPMLTENAKGRLQKALDNLLNQSTKLTITVAENDTMTPAQITQADSDARQQAAEQKINEDPHVQAILEQFDGTIAPGSVKAVEPTV